MIFLRSLFKTLVLLSWLQVSSLANALNLPIEAEADRLLFAAQTALGDKHYAQAQQYLEKAQALNISLPANFHYLYGTTLFHRQQLNNASKHLITYASTEKRGAAHYKDVLSMLTVIENKTGETAKAIDEQKPNTSKNTALIIPDDDYIGQLKNLYLTDKADKALLKHINSLLSSYTMQRPAAVITSNQQALSRYRLSHDQKGNLIVSSQFVNQFSKKTNRSFIDTTKINIFGIDPFISYHCAPALSSCWLRSPSNGSKWIEFTGNEDAAKELAKAVTALIKILQKG